LEIQGLLLDLDGTLIQTEIANMKAYNFALEEFGLNLSLDEFQTTNGVDSSKFLSHFFPELSDFDILEIKKVKSNVYEKFLSDTYLNINLLGFIDNFFNDKKIGIVTTGKKKNVTQILDFHKIGGRFDFAVTGDDVLNQKPNPEPYFKAIKKMGLSREDILVFEDSKIGCASASAAGLRIIRVPPWESHEN